MFDRSSAWKCGLAVISLLFTSTVACAQSPVTQEYGPTLSSLDSHPLPQWYADAKLGIFVHWGLYSVPGWAPLQHPGHDFSSLDYIKNNPYAEWYYNVMRIHPRLRRRYLLFLLRIHQHKQPPYLPVCDQSVSPQLLDFAWSNHRCRSGILFVVARVV